jgi:hypothetical protein
VYRHGLRAIITTPKSQTAAAAAAAATSFVVVCDRILLDCMLIIITYIDYP